MKRKSSSVQSNPSSKRRTRSSASSDESSLIAAIPTYASTSTQTEPDASRTALQLILDNATPNELAELCSPFDALAEAELKIANLQAIIHGQSVNIDEAARMLVEQQTRLDSVLEELEELRARKDGEGPIIVEIREEESELTAELAMERHERQVIERQYDELKASVIRVTEEFTDLTESQNTNVLGNPQVKLETLAQVIKDKFREWSENQAVLKEELYVIRKAVGNLDGISESGKLQVGSPQIRLSEAHKSGQETDQSKTAEKTQIGQVSPEQRPEISNHVSVKSGKIGKLRENRKTLRGLSNGGNATSAVENGERTPRLNSMEPSTAMITVRGRDSTKPSNFKERERTHSLLVPVLKRLISNQ